LNPKYLPFPLLFIGMMYFLWSTLNVGPSDTPQGERTVSTSSPEKGDSGTGAAKSNSDSPLGGKRNPVPKRDGKNTETKLNQALPAFNPPLENAGSKEEGRENLFDVARSQESVRLLASIERFDANLSISDLEEYFKSVREAKSREEILALATRYADGNIPVRSQLLKWGYREGYIEKKELFITNTQPGLSGGAGESASKE
jgi:hypothetical protein